ncbi:MAG: dolichyl-diphosphooligosaccharide--protein glycosyltransferase subunit STT3, partial [Lachnospiraceae bacterium]|nr:dolichyl-diphosphooligosaccharide--protein glycosyltransferase subunit STT3 [Lachnospiraceae bacterium]
SPVSTKENGLVTNGLPLIAALVYRFLNLFSDITIEMVVYYLNAVICSLAAVFAYLFIKKQTNVVGGVVSAVLIVTMVPFFEHSVAGYFDTDAMLCTVPLCLVCCYATMVQSEEFKKKVTYAILSVLVFGLLAATWETFYIYFGLLGIMSVITIIEFAVVKGNDGSIGKKMILRETLMMAIVLAVMALLAFLMYGGTMIDSIRRLVTNMLATNNYPDPTKYIVELSESPILDNGLAGAFLTTGTGIINKLGGVLVLVQGVLSIILMIVVRKKVSARFLATNIGFVISWFLVTLPFLIVGSRFLQLVCIPLSLLVGLGVGLLSKMIVINTNKLLGYIVSSFIGALVLFGPFVGALVRNTTPAPFYNKTFDESCKWINTFASENADILTWWDYGYFIQYASARHVLSDGGTFDGRYFYWLSRALLTNDPKMSVAIFDMLNFGGVDSVDVAEEYIGDSEKANQALLDILPLSKEQGEVVLMSKYNLNKKEAESIIGIAKPEDKDEHYLIISRDLIAKIGALAYYGFYDFHNDTYDVSLGVSTAPVIVSVFEEKVDVRGIDDVHVVIKKDAENDYVALVDDMGDLVDISRIIYVENGMKIKDEYKGPTGYTLYCINDEGEYSFIVCSENIADSMLVSLMAYNSNEYYTRVYTGVLGDNMSSSDSATARFFGNSDTPENAGVFIYKVNKGQASEELEQINNLAIE